MNCNICHLPRQTKSGLCFSCLDKAYSQALKMAGEQAEINADTLGRMKKLAADYGAISNDLCKMAQRALERENTLKAIQWSGRSFLQRPICPACKQAKEQGHKAECVIGRALKPD